MRLFAALVPPPQALDHLDHALSGPRSRSEAVLRWVPREKLHVTLAFYGEVPDGALPAIAAELESMGGGPAPELDLRGAGTFAERTLWVGVGGDVDAVRGLMRRAGGVGGREPERRNRPHITVARGGRRSRDLDLRPVVHAVSVYRGPRWRPEEILLMASHLGQGRSGSPRYEVVAEVPFG